VRTSLQRRHLTVLLLLLLASRPRQHQQRKATALLLLLLLKGATKCPSSTMRTATRKVMTATCPG